jgi:hypothetical protein
MCGAVGGREVRSVTTSFIFRHEVTKDGLLRNLDQSC